MLAMCVSSLLEENEKNSKGQIKQNQQNTMEKFPLNNQVIRFYLPIEVNFSFIHNNEKKYVK